MFRDDTASKKARTAWLKLRAHAIKDRVEAFDVLRLHKVELVHRGTRPESFSCPFHGADRHPSCRYHPRDGRDSSHVWCFVCQELWDPITLWRKFNGDGDIQQGFSRALTEMERHFGVTPPPMPKVEDIDVPDEDDPVVVEVKQLFEVCEARLRENRQSFAVKSFLTLCVLLDRLYRSYRIGKLTPADTRHHLRRMLDKIGEKIRAS
jgi:hypothetical protein